MAFLSAARIYTTYGDTTEDPVAIIRRNADQIIDTVFDNLYEKLSGSDFFEEDLALGVRLIMVDAFIRCKILEEPRTE